jgi:hypothetical protein
MVRHYGALGVRYFQPFNEPNLRDENGGRQPDPVRYGEQWLAAARKIVEAGGLPGFGALSPNGDVDDVEFLRVALRTVRERGGDDVLDRTWISMHNYTGNTPIADSGSSAGFYRFRAYDAVVREALGRSLPVIGTEGGSLVGTRSDPARPTVQPEAAATMTRQAMDYAASRREPYLFANAVWVLANRDGGGHDPRWEPHALFSGGIAGPVARDLKSSG